MKFLRPLRALFLTLAALLAVASVARAQVFETFVSGAGDDGNTCARTLPCKTFAGAFRVTLPGGTITVLDPGNFGPVTITHSISIEGHGVAEILANGTNGITIDAGASDVVHLRGLTLDGLGSAGGQGILVNEVGSFVVEDTEIRNFGGNGILFAAGAPPVSPTSSPKGATSTSSRSNTQHNVTVSNNGGVGISIGTLANPVNVGLTTTLKQVNIIDNFGGGLLLATREQAAAAATYGHEVSNALNYNSTKSNTGNIVDCVISGNGGFGGVGVSDATSGRQQHSLLFVNNSSVVGNNGAGLVVQGKGAAITMSNVEINTNTTGVASLLGGQILSFGNNRNLGNTTAGTVTSEATQQ